MAQLQIPSSYATLGFKQIKVENYPKDAAGVAPIQVLTLHRPGKHNAFTYTMAEELELAFSLFDVDDRVRCIVVAGDGRIFCAGADLESEFKKEGNKRPDEHRDEGGRVALAIHRCRKPVIGALNGAAVGIGITMTLPMAVRLAPRDAKIGFVFGRRGLIMEAASSYFLPRLIGHSAAMHIITTGATYPASHPLLSGLFSETLPDAKGVMSRALEIAQDFVNNCSGVSWAVMRDLMWRGPSTAEGTHLLDSRLIYEMFQTGDNLEGVRSFLEKRPVQFKGTMANDAPSAYPWWEPVNVISRPPASKEKSRL